MLQILKTVLEAQAPTNSKQSPDKLLKVCSPNMNHGKSHIKCYNFCQQCEDYFATVKAKGVNQIFFAMSFF